MAERYFNALHHQFRKQPPPLFVYRVVMAACKRVIYSGRVQGVGFRYTTQRLASGLQVAGYVKNLPDGNVELVAEGEPDQVDGLLARIAQRMGRYIDGTDVSDQPPQGLAGFQIRH